MKDILSDIIENKRMELRFQKQAISVEYLREEVDAMLLDSSVRTGNGQYQNGEASLVRSMKQALSSSSTGIIAEFKRRSPSKGWINEAAKPEIVPSAYEAAGASALSILTDEKFFGGSLRDILAARPLVNIPILRKDFIIDEYQLLQARFVNADAILLIAACLTPDECHTLTAQAHALNLEVLLEVHSLEELSYINKDTDMVGVNNRNLGTFVTDIQNSFRIAEELKQAVSEICFTNKESKPSASPLLVSESGISDPETIKELRSVGFRGFLIGETFMSTKTPGNTLKSFIDKL